ncbi:FAD-binding oxidoreductase [Rhodoferax fermentans]|uniref:FAD-binding oxidoreductase n=1 Tax=Rhodoferax fermentans TaxID=28066 RepID=A0A1T1AT57_RHOFE|nr:FAD-binding oxidoreductase [Rhodoferax fermentans]MBK1682255.1 FAD-binding oxidoreductase [Rhodoferax fermentans]OOV07286.1 FAD-binding oxidoreductase [Rhodoferax fermentans]
MRPVSAWGRLDAASHDVVSLHDPAKIACQITSKPRGIAHGNGRSYGDVCLNPDGVLWHTTGLNHFISFDQSSGRLVCEAGVLLREIQRLVIPLGWILPVTPGTQLVTVGGAIANDVHGKNHHVLGSFGDHVQRIRLLRTVGQTIECGPQDNADWFAATVGGLGLTGIIVEAEIQLCRVAGPWLATDTVPYANLGEFFQLADESEADWQHTVSWLDCLDARGRGLFMRGNPTDVCNRPDPQSRKRTMPIIPPVSLVNPLSLRAFNMAYFHLKKWRAGQAIAHYESFFYPLDNILEWNRIYGPKGFYQYQCVVPRDVGQDATRAMLGEIARCSEGSFLAVLKTFGERQPVGMLSFPRPGVTLALDFPQKGLRTQMLFDRLDGIVREAGGRIYAAKDARMPRSLFEAGYPRLSEFMKYRDSGISSGLSRRLMGS